MLGICSGTDFKVKPRTDKSSVLCCLFLAGLTSVLQVEVFWTD